MLFQAAISFSGGHLETSIGNFFCSSLRSNESELYHS
ncbi:unnamed protein product [Callosobruchus maculatus]|uniref:Uncharacterized protein n=1 Tax=Callosobruchus maculatus TaxID=64391 RepID=A0A653CFR5_CALMS|nr:unnamed protein product [Callosobruchus maculatus]